MGGIAAKVVPRVTMNIKKQYRVEAWEYLFEKTNNDDIFLRASQ